MNKKSFKDSFIYKLGNEIRDTCNKIHIKQYKKLETLFVLLCLQSYDIYFFNILRIINLFYHMYVEHEIYVMSYKKEGTILHDYL